MERGNDKQRGAQYGELFFFFLLLHSLSVKTSEQGFGLKTRDFFYISVSICKAELHWGKRGGHREPAD